MDVKVDIFDTPQLRYDKLRKEFNNWYNNKLIGGKYLNVNTEHSQKLYDEVVPNTESGIVKGVNDDFMYVQVLSGTKKKDEVDMRMNLSMIVPLLHAIVAMLIISGKTLQEHRLLVTRLSKLSQLSQHRHHQSEHTVSPSSEAKETCESTIAILSKVTRMYSSARAGLVWLSQLGRAINCVKVKVMNALTHFLVKILEVALL